MALFSGPVSGLTFDDGGSHVSGSGWESLVGSNCAQVIVCHDKKISCEVVQQPYKP